MIVFCEISQTVLRVMRGRGQSLVPSTLRASHSLVQPLDTVGDTRNVLNRSTVSDDTVLHRLVPEPLLDELAQEPGVHDLELSRQDTTRVNVGRVRLEALVEAEDLRRGRSGHRCQEQRIAETVLGDLLLEAGPVPKVGGSDAPEVVLQLTARSGGALVGLVGTVALGELA